MIHLYSNNLVMNYIIPIGGRGVISWLRYFCENDAKINNVSWRLGSIENTSGRPILLSGGMVIGCVIFQVKPQGKLSEVYN